MRTIFIETCATSLLAAVAAWTATAEDLPVRSTADVEVVFKSLDRNSDRKISRSEASVKGSVSKRFDGIDGQRAKLERLCRYVSRPPVARAIGHDFFGSGEVPAQDGLSRWHHAHCDGAAGSAGKTGSTGAATADAPDEVSWVFAPHTLPGSPTAIVKAVRSLGLEGVIAKRKHSAYVPGERTDDWQKLKLENQQEFVIGRYRPDRAASMLCSWATTMTPAYGSRARCEPASFPTCVARSSRR